MNFKLRFTRQAIADLDKLNSEKNLAKRLKAVHKTLGYLQLNPKHPSLNTHKYKSLTAEDGSDVFEAYAENHTPGAYRIFWHYGPESKQITIISIVPHP